MRTKRCESAIEDGVVAIRRRTKDSLPVRDDYGGAEISRDGCVDGAVGADYFLNKSSLVEWFLAQKGTVNGFQNALFSGFTTDELSRIIENLIINYPTANGLWHVSAEPIDKYRLLQLLKASFNKDTEIVITVTYTEILFDMRFEHTKSSAN